jgi:RNA polymerase sigma-70 factor (ECF subfamily)
MSTAEISIAIGRASGASAPWDNVAAELPLMDEASKLALFEHTIVPHLNDAHNLARWLTRNQQDAEDVVQEAYLRAFRFFDGFHGGDGRAWLLAVVRNTCISWMGRRTGAESTSVEFDEHVHRAADEAESAEQVLIRNSKIESLRACVETLPVEYREVIVMRELQELSYREISEVAGIPIGTVMSRLSRGRMRLLDCMETK